MTEQVDEILDGLGTSFPLHAAKCASLTGALTDVLGQTFRAGGFFFVFLDSFEDAVLLEVDFISSPLQMTIPGVSSFSVSLGQADELELDLAVSLDDSGAWCFLFDAPIFVQFSSDLLTPVVRHGERWEPDLESDGKVKKVTLVFSGVSLEIDSSGRVEATTDVKVDLQPVQIGKSGVVVEMKGLRLCMSDQAQLPIGLPPGSRGFAIDSVDVFLPESIQGSFAPDEIKAEGLFIGSGGFTGKLSAEWSDGKPLQLGGIDCTLKSLMFDFKQNSLVQSELICELTLPFFDRPVNLDVSFSGDGSLLASLSAVQPEGVDYDAGLIRFEKENVFKATIEGISFGVKDGISTLSVNGGIQPIFLSQASQAKDEAPTFKIRELSIDSQGHVKFDGGWMDLPEQYVLDFHGFKIGITKLGFGKTEDGGKWVGFSGELKLVDGFTAGASVDGLKVTWYDGNPNKTKITLDGVGVEFEIPEVLRFKGHVAYQELDVGGASIHRFVGDIKLKLIALKMDVDAKLIIGSASGGPEGNYNFFAIYLAAELPTGIPITPTPLALYGMAGLFALQMEPNKTESQEWYDDWYKKPTAGVTDLEKKWVNRRGSMAFGVGATIGTISDNGFTFGCEALLVILFPGKIFLLEGKANLLKERAKLKDDPMFRALAVLDMREGQIQIGLDAKYQRKENGEVIDIRAGAEAFFKDPGDWHVYMGEQEPREKRIRALVLQLFEANAYFMIEPTWLKTGIWVGYAKRWKFGPVGLTLEAWIEANVKVNWTPLHFHGDLWLHGNVEINVFGFGLGLCVDARFEADVFEPYHVKASIEVSIKLPKPLKKKHVEITLEWGPTKVWPKQFPLPLKEVAIEHFKVTTSWPLPRNSTLFPDYDPDNDGMRTEDIITFDDKFKPGDASLSVVSLDCRPHISFGRPVHDDAFVGVNPQQLIPDYERIGDPNTDVGPVKVRYSLTKIELFKWDPQTKDWRTVAVAGRSLNSGERRLFGSWAAVPQLPSGTGQTSGANTKLWLWSKTPFDYTRHGGSGVDDWFTKNFPTYPCVPQDIPDREVCIDVERLDRSQLLENPWRSPEHPEISLSTWIFQDFPSVMRVTVLNPPLNGFTKALCFDSSVIGVPSQITVNLSAPAKRVKLWIVEKKKADKVCLNFRNRKPGLTERTLIEQNVTIDPTGPMEIKSIATTLGDMTGLHAIPDNFQRGVMHINLPPATATVELMLSYLSNAAGALPPKIEAFDSKGNPPGAGVMLNPPGQPEIVRFEDNDLMRITISPGVGGFFVLHELCFFSRDTAPSVTATGFSADGKPTAVFANQGNLVEISGKDLTQVQVNAPAEICLLKICALFGPDPKEVAHRREMAVHLAKQVERWEDVGAVLEPFSAYRLTIATTIHAVGEGELSGSRHLEQREHAYFRTEGPPGLTTLSLPAGRDPAEADKFDSGLEDLTRYVSQTTPATVPADGQKPVMAKPFYRAYDVEVEFNEDYVDLMYRISGRDLGLYLYTNNNLPVRDADGRLLVESGDWGKVEELTLTEGEQRWVALSNAKDRCLPVISTKTIARDKKLTSAVAGRVLEPDMIYEARLIPLLLREGFQKLAAGTSAQGPAGKLGRWAVRDEGNINAPSKWEVRETPTPVSKYLIQTTNIKGGKDDATNPVKPGSLLLYGNDPGLDSGHSEQPLGWTDYRLSAYLNSGGDGAMGLVFRYRDNDNYYRLSLDRHGKYRRLVSVANGAHTVLQQDDFTYKPKVDYLITVEAIGDLLRVYQDGALIFKVQHGTHKQGSIGLYCYDNASARFNDVRLDDFRQTAPVVYRFEFTTSLFANFFHHLHSYQDETWRIALENVPSARPTMAKAVKPNAPLTDDEARAYETLATTVLGPAARQNPPEVQVTRVEIDGAPLALLVQSPEPIDWLRTEIAFWRTSLARTEPALPGKVKLVAVKFAANRINIDSVDLLLREPMNLTGWRIEGRLVTWPVSPTSGVVIDVLTLSGGALAEQAWATYRLLEAEKHLASGTVLRIQPDTAISISPAGLVGVDAVSVDPARRVSYSIELRIVAPDGKIVHARHFLPDNDYVAEDMSVLRKADGTGVFIVKPDGGSSVTPLLLGQYRLKLTFHRNNRTRVPKSQIWGQAGSDTDETVTLDIPLQTQ